MKTEVSLILSLALLVTLSSTAPAATAAVSANENRDHPLITSYEGSQIRSKDMKSFDEYNAFIGMDDTGTTPQTLDLEGKVTKIIYRAIKERSTLEIFRNYQLAIEQAGGELLYACNQDKGECVKRYAGVVLRDTSDIHSIRNNNGRYLLAKLVQEDQTAYVVVAVSDVSSTIHVVEVHEMETGLVSLNTNTLGQELDEQGYVVVDGLYFDDDKSRLQSRSQSALIEISDLLTDRPELSVHIVGHTDSNGNFERNMALSKSRALAVIDKLVNEYQVDPARLEGHGVGPLAPQFGIVTEEDKAKNRRVVMVAR